MVPGDNPLHSKSPDEPVTIDLEAERVVADAAPAQGDTTSDPLPPTDEPIATEAGADEQAAPEPDAAEPDPEPVRQTEEPLRPAPPAAKPASSGSSIAAGIFGGLIALLGAGSIQYAGLIPSLAPAEKSAPAGPDYAAEIATLDARITELTGKPAATPDLSALETRLAALESSVSDLASRPAASAADPATDATVKAMNDKLNALTADLAATQSSLADAQKKLEAPKTEINVGKAIATSALKAAIDRGGPFASELETLANVAPDDPAIANLQPYAKAGVLSRAQLTKQMPDVADTILSTVNQPAPGTGLTERLVQSALSVIKVRPVGDVEGAGPESIVARMEERLQNGDIKGAAEQWDTLPEAAKAVSNDFKAALDSRIAVEGLIGNAMSDAVSGSVTKG